MYKTTNIVDSVLEDISPEITLPVITGAAQNTFSSYAATSKSTSQILFDFQLPSSQSAISRKFLFKTGLTIKIDFIDNLKPGEIVFSYGESDAFQAFPFNSIVNTSQATLNTSTITTTLNYIMAPLLKLYNPEELAQFNSLCPSMVDGFYLNYANAVGSNNNVLGGYNVGGYDKKNIPRGAFPVAITNADPNFVMESDDKTLPYTIKVDDSGNYPKSIYVACTTVEPLLFLSPFISGAADSVAGFLGISKMSLQFNLGACNKIWSSGTYAKTTSSGDVKVKTIRNITLSKEPGDPTILTNVYTLPSSLYAKMTPRNVCPYIGYGQLTTQAQAGIPPGGTGVIQTSTQQLTGIPSKLVIVARKPIGSQNWYDSNSFFVIQAITINANNNSGLLASATMEQLYNMSVANGSQQNYYEFSGKGSVGSEYVINEDGYLVPGNGKNSKISTLGSVLVIDPALDLALPEVYTNGSSDSFSLQFAITVYNQSSETVSPEICVVTVNNGIFITENGSCQTQVNILKKDEVLACKSEPALMDSQSYVKEVVGGSIENLGGIHKHLKKMFSSARFHEKKIDEDPAKENAAGMSAGAMSAGDVMGTASNLANISSHQIGNQIERAKIKRRVHDFGKKFL
jgi:hypothetical protein